MSLEKRKLGQQGLEVSAIGLLVYLKKMRISGLIIVGVGCLILFLLMRMAS